MENFAIRDVMDVTFYDIVTGEPVLYFDTLKMSNFETTAETTTVTGGKGNPEILAFDHSRKGTVDIQDALFSMKSFAILAGLKNPITGVCEIHAVEEKVPVVLSGGSGGSAGTGSISVTGAPTTAGNLTIAIGADSQTVAVLDTDDAAGVATKIKAKTFTGYVLSGTGSTITITQAAGTYSAATVTVTFGAGSTGATGTATNVSGGTAPSNQVASATIAQSALAGSVSYMAADGEVTMLATATGTSIELTGLDPAVKYVDLFYRFNSDATAKKVTISAKAFPGIYKVVGDTTMFEECSGQEVKLQVVIPKAKLSPGFKIELTADGNPAVFDFKLQTLQGCDNDELVNFIQY